MFRKSLITIIALLLATQGVNAVTMPLCEHGSAGPAVQHKSQQHIGAGHEHHVHAQDLTEKTDHDASHRKPEQGATGHDDLVCDDCEVCALSGAAALASAELHDGVDTRSGSPSPVETLLFGVTPHHLSKPPLLA